MGNSTLSKEEKVMFKDFKGKEKYQTALIRVIREANIEILGLFVKRSGIKFNFNKTLRFAASNPNDNENERMAVINFLFGAMKFYNFSEINYDATMLMAIARGNNEILKFILKLIIIKAREEFRKDLTHYIDRDRLLIVAQEYSNISVQEILNIVQLDPNAQTIDVRVEETSTLLMIINKNKMDIENGRASWRERG